MAMAKKGTNTHMSVQTNALRIKKDAPNVDSYVNDIPTAEVDTSVELFEEDSENEVPDRSSVIQTGWAAAKRAASEANKSYTADFKFDEDVQLIKFLSAEPMSFLQHWVQRPGKKSFIGWENDPLSRVGNKPERKFAFTVVNLSDEEPQIQMMTCGIRLCGQLEKLNSDKKTGPLDRPDIYWAVSKSGQGTKTSYSIMPVKERDLVEDWEIDPAVASELTSKMKPLGADALRMSTTAELEEIAKEIIQGQ
jgi:hypothetical protein